MNISLRNDSRERLHSIIEYNNSIRKYSLDDNCLKVFSLKYIFIEKHYGFKSTENLHNSGIYITFRSYIYSWVKKYMITKDHNSNGSTLIFARFVPV
jgi:hypothetical protein